MSVELLPESCAETEAMVETTVAEARDGSPAGVRRALVCAWKHVAGAALCQTLAGALLVNGWTFRLMQREALRRWWKRRPELGGPDDERFEDFARTDESRREHAHWPNWILRQEFTRELRQCRATPGVFRRMRRRLGACFGSLWRNAVVGVQAFANTFALLLPAGLLWIFAWDYGWNVSFHKDYEHSGEGGALGLIGVACFTAAMLYLPMAQARQAVTGSMRAFWDYRVVRAVTKARWGAVVVLAGLHALAAFPFLIALAIIPLSLPAIAPSLETLNPEDARSLLGAYFFGVALVGFPAFVLLKALAARIYATGVLRALARGTLAPSDLHDAERRPLAALCLLDARRRGPSNVVLRSARWLGSRTGRAASFIAVVVLWFAFVAQIFVAQFFSFVPHERWLNQPLVQLPHFAAMPPERAEE